MKYKILKILSESSDYVSGEEIGSIFGISRAAVWKNISALKSKGYNIESVSNRGYRLIDNIDVLSKDDIKYDNVFYKEEIGSTNDEGKRQAANGCKDKLLVICDNQTAGKGRLGRSWVGEKNAGIYMSFVLMPDILPYKTPQLTLITGVAAMKAINNVTGLKTKIKWPNDIIINGKKLAGILAEMNAEMEKVNYIVVGIGINVNVKSFNDELKDKATSIYIETGKKFKRSDIINEFINQFIKYYNEFCQKGFSVFKNEYNENCANVGMSVKTLGGKEQITGIAKGVNSDGELVIENENGVFNILGGEVSLRLSDDRYI